MIAASLGAGEAKGKRKEHPRETMKPLLLCSLLLAGCSVAHAQNPIGSRALPAIQVKRANWPRFVSGTSGVYAPQYLALQFLLRNQGFYESAPQESYNSIAFQHAIQTFQRAKGLKVDGIVGPQTWAKLCPRLKRGDKGDAVRAFQSLLEVKTDGLFGFDTEAALRKSQKSSALKADGVVGAQTWAMLLSIPEPETAG